MADIEALLRRWQEAGVLDAPAAARIRSFETEQKQPAGMRWQVVVALILGAILLACGIILFVSAHWDRIGPGARFALVMAMVASFHLGGSLVRERFRALSTALHAVGTVATGAAIALVGQIFNIEEHWPAAILLWALAAVAGWVLLRDQAQQVLTLLLLPAWMLCELSYATKQHIGQPVYMGRFLFVWSILYLTFFLGSRRKAVQGILFAAGAIAALAGVFYMLEGWRSWYALTGFIPFTTRVWAWGAIAGVPLVIAAFRGHRGLVPPAIAVGFAIALPWCQRLWSFPSPYGQATYTMNSPNLLAHALVTGFAVFIIWWGVRQASRALVNYGIVGFALSVAWFYFSDLFDKMGRALGLICLGLLFLLGGWALEAMRRRLLAAMPAKEAQ